jgi:hypothetical protein
MNDVTNIAYARCAADKPARPVYQPTDDFIQFKRSVRLAAIDVMILTYAARRHARWLSKIGVCPPDVAALIMADVDAVAKIIGQGQAVNTNNNAKPTPISAPSPRLAHVGPCSPRAQTGDGDTPGLFDAQAPTSAKRAESTPIGTTNFYKSLLPRGEQSRYLFDSLADEKHPNPCQKGTL